MKKLFALVLVVAFMATAVNAQSGLVPKEKSGGYARVQAMGGEGGSNPFFVDPLNMTLTRLLPNTMATSSGVILVLLLQPLMMATDSLQVSTSSSTINSPLVLYFQEMTTKEWESPA